MAILPKATLLRWLRTAADLHAYQQTAQAIPGVIRRAIVRTVHRGQLRDLRSGIESQQAVQVTYQKDSGELIERRVQPYEIKPHRTSGRLMVYVTDDMSGPQQIKSYAASGLRQTTPTDEEFDPTPWGES